MVARCSQRFPEVHSDQYDEIISILDKKITNGEIDGLPPTTDARDIVKKGHFTYEQAKKITQFGTIESLAYDSATGVITASSSFGVSAAITFSREIWNGSDVKESICKSIDVGLSVAGDAFISNVLTSQIQRVGTDKILKKPADYIAKKIGNDLAAKILNATNAGNISGSAASRNLSKQLRGYSVSAIANVFWTSRDDFLDFFNTRISGSQLSKNVVKNALSGAGGTVGYISGTTIGAQIGSVIPGPGTVVGGLIRGLTCSALGSKIINFLAATAMNKVIDDDSVILSKIISEVYADVCCKYMLTETESAHLFNGFTSMQQDTIIKGMYSRYKSSSQSAYNYIYDMLDVMSKDLLRKRAHVSMPTSELIERALCTSEEVKENGTIDQYTHKPEEGNKIPVESFDDIIDAFTDYFIEGKRIVSIYDIIQTKQHENMCEKSGYSSGLILFDTTVFRSGKSGLIVTDASLVSYGHSKGNEEVPLSEINTISMHKSENMIIINNDIHLNFIHREYREKICTLVKLINQYIEQFK